MLTLTWKRYVFKEKAPLKCDKVGLGGVYMPIITKITTQTKRTDRYNIFIDEKYAFSVAEEVLLKFQLKKGKEIDSLLLSQIKYPG